MPDNVIGSAQFLISMGLDPSSLIESQAQTKIAAQAMRQAVQDAVERIKVDPNAPAVQFAKSLGVTFEQTGTQAAQAAEKIAAAQQRIQRDQQREQQRQSTEAVRAQRERQRQAEAAGRAGPNVAIGGQRVALTADNVAQVRAQAQAFASDPLRQQAAEIQKIASGAKEVDRGFTLSSQSAIRIGAALTGIPLGLNIMAGAARDVHRAFADALDAELGIERQTRTVTAALGEQRAVAAQAAAQRFVQDPNTAGTRAEFLQAQARIQPTAQQLNLPEIQTADVLRQSGELAQTWGSTLPQASAAYEAALRGNVDALQAYGVVLTDAYGRLRSVGLTYQQLATVIGPAAAAQQVLRDVTAQVAQQHENQKNRAHDLNDELIHLQKNAEAAKNQLGTLLAGPGQVVAGAAATAIGGAPTQAQQAAITQRARDLLQQQGYTEVVGSAATGVPTGGLRNAQGQVLTQQQANAVRAEAVRLATTEASAQQLTNSAAAQGIPIQSAVADSIRRTTGAVQEQTSAYRLLQEEVQRHLDTINEIGQRQAAQAQVGAALRGPDFDAGVAREGDITRIGQAQAGMDIIAQQQRNVAYDAAGAVRQQLVEAITTAAEIGPRAVEQATRDLDEFDRRAAAHATQVRAQLAQAALAPVRSAVQVESTGLDLAAAGRRVAVADQLAGLTRERLTLEGQIAPIQREQADVQARIALHSQENLTLTRQTLEAQRAAQQPLANQSDLSYREQRLELQAQQLRAQQIRGTAPADASAQLATIRAQLRNASLDEPGVGLAALDAQHNVEVQRRAQQADQLGQQLANLPDLIRLQQLQQDAAPIEAAMRAEQEREASVQRRLALEDNADAPTRARLQLLVASADHVAAQAQDMAVRAQDFAAGLDLGATNAERIANALGRANEILQGSASNAPAGSGVGTHTLREGDGPPSQYVGVGLNPPAQNPPPVTVAPSATTRSATVQIADNGDVNINVDAGTSREDIAQQVHAIYAERERQTIAKIVNALDNAPEPVNGALVGG